MKITNMVLCLHILTVTGIQAAAMESHEKAGTTTANFLKIGSNAHAVGLGEAVTALADGISFAAYNPANVSLDRLALTGTHTELYDGVSVEEVALGIPFGRKFGIILRGNGVMFDKTERRDQMGARRGDYTAASMALGAGFYWTAGPLTVGAFGKSIQQKIDAYSASTVAADVGIRLRTPLDGLSIGASMLNAGRPVIFVKQEDELPRALRAGAGFDNGHLKLGVDAVKYIDQELFLSAGGEVTLFGGLSLRGGYSGNSELQSPFKAGIGLTFSALELNYAYNPGDELGAAHRVSLTIK